MTFTDPIIGGSSVLVREAIRSRNYVAGVSGWTVNRDGTAEFNATTIRGSLLVTDPDGSYVRVYDENPGDGAIIEFGLPTIGLTRTPGSISSTTDALGTGQPGLIITSPTVNGTPTAVLAMIADTVEDESRVSIGGDNLSLFATDEVRIVATSTGIRLSTLGSTGDILCDVGFGGEFKVLNTATRSTFEGDVQVDGDLKNGDGFKYMRGQRGNTLISFPAAQSATPAFAFPTPFPPGQIPNVHVNINSSNGSTRYWTARAYNVTETGFNFWFSVSDAARPAEAWVNVPVQWTAVID